MPAATFFSFGAVLYEMATGVCLFDGKVLGRACSAILRDEPPTPSQVNPNSCGTWKRMIAKALEKDRNLRYQHASDMRSDLQRLKRRNRVGSFGALYVHGHSQAGQLANRGSLRAGCGPHRLRGGIGGLVGAPASTLPTLQPSLRRLRLRPRWRCCHL